MYFSNHWKSDFYSYLYTGPTLANKMQKHERILDVGCGNNYFMPYFPNLIGIDPANDAAHIKTTLEDYNPATTFDVALCLGSLNFGTEDKIKTQLDKLHSLMNRTSRIYWRCNPGINDHSNTDGDKVVFYPWTIKKLKEFANYYHYTVNDVELDFNALGHVRIYCEWVR